MASYISEQQLNYDVLSSTVLRGGYNAGHTSSGRLPRAAQRLFHVHMIDGHQTRHRRQPSAPLALGAARGAALGQVGEGEAVGNIKEAPVSTVCACVSPNDRGE